MIYLKTLFLCLLTFTQLYAQQAYWVFLEDNPVNHPVTLTEKAEQRILLRGKRTPAGSQNISTIRLNQLRVAGFKIRHSSRFLNAVSLEINNNQDLTRLHQLPFVRSIQPVAQRASRISPINEPSLPRGSGIDYGRSLTQNEMLHIPTIHDLGYDGEGVMIGVFDAGIVTDHLVFDHLDIRATYDFVDHEINPDGGGEAHGVYTLSTLAGYLPETFIGPAYGATYLLARTEDINSESRLEEDNWVAALEWADSLGVDIISSSLNYRYFDDIAENYPFSALDGQTTIITRAANIAAQRGILVVNSMGNEGPGVSTVWPPADSPHVLSVGAVSAYGGVIAMSGRGPTYDGRIKPDVLAMGFSVFVASGLDDYVFTNGTSVATPLISGLAALLLQAHPNLSPDSVIALFRSHGNNSDLPDNSRGYGIPNLLGVFPKFDQRVTKNCLIYPNPSSAETIQFVLPLPVTELIHTSHVYNIRGQHLASLDLQILSETTLQLSLPSNQVLSDQLLIITVEAEGNLYSGKLIYLK